MPTRSQYTLTAHDVRTMRRPRGLAHRLKRLCLMRDEEAGDTPAYDPAIEKAGAKAVAVCVYDMLTRLEGATVDYGREATGCDLTTSIAGNVALALVTRPQFAHAALVRARAMGRRKISDAYEAQSSNVVPYSYCVVKSTTEHLISRPGTPYFAVTIDEFWRSVDLLRNDAEQEEPQYVSDRFPMPLCRHLVTDQIMMASAILPEELARCVRCKARCTNGVVRCHCEQAVYCSARCLRHDAGQTHACSDTLSRLRTLMSRTYTSGKDYGVLVFGRCVLPLHMSCMLQCMELPMLYPGAGQSDVQFLYANASLAQNAYETATYGEGRAVGDEYEAAWAKLV